MGRIAHAGRSAFPYNLRLMVLRAMFIGMTICAATASTAQHTQADAKAAPSPSTALTLTLQLRSTRLKPGEHPWFRVIMKNVGKKPTYVRGRQFREPRFAGSNSYHKHNLYFELRRGDGSPGSFGVYDIDHHCVWASTGPPRYEKEGRKQFELMLKDGYPEEEAAHWAARYMDGLAGGDDPHPALLAPGQSIVSSPWQPGNIAGCEPEAPPPPHGFAELFAHIHTYEAGRYKIRAVYEDNLGDIKPPFISDGKSPAKRLVDSAWIDIIVQP